MIGEVDDLCVFWRETHKSWNTLNSNKMIADLKIGFYKLQRNTRVKSFLLF